MNRLAPTLISLLLLAGCGTSPAGSESTRAMVLQYLGGDVGTAGPFGKGGKKELTVLADGDRIEAESLIDGGAMMFLVFGGTAAAGTPASSASSGPSRIVLVQDGKIVRDYLVRRQTP